MSLSSSGASFRNALRRLADARDIEWVGFGEGNGHGYRIQDNASYHKKQETYEWFQANRRYVEVFQLPPYWPELNAAEKIWKYTRKHVTHNRFFERPQDLCKALFRRFDYVRQHPQEIEGLLDPFF